MLDWNKNPFKPSYACGLPIPSSGEFRTQLSQKTCGMSFHVQTPPFKQCLACASESVADTILDAKSGLHSGAINSLFAVPKSKRCSRLRIEAQVPMFGFMKRISFFLALAIIGAPTFLRAQDAATEERLNKLTAQVQDLIEMQAAQGKRIDAVTKELQNLQQAQANKPAVDYASQEDLKQLAAKVQEVDRKRQDDNERILEELKKLGSTIRSGGARRPPVPDQGSANDGGSSRTNLAQKGFEYKIQSGDTLIAIAKAYSEAKAYKLTVKQILDNNPGLDERKLKPGQTIFIPAPQ
jgi:LysM repeat protein